MQAHVENSGIECLELLASLAAELVAPGRVQIPAAIALLAYSLSRQISLSGERLKRVLTLESSYCEQAVVFVRVEPLNKIWMQGVQMTPLQTF
jgi:hypothetical protein